MVFDGCLGIVNTKIIGYQNYEAQAKELKSNIQELKIVKSQFENLQNKLDKTTKKLTNIDENIESTQKHVKKFSELFGPESGSKSTEGFSSSLAKQTALHLQKTVHQNEDREKNIIIFGVKEQEDEEVQVKKEKDNKFFNDMCTNALDIRGMSIRNIVRIGKKPDDIQSKCRPLKVSFEDTFDKRKFLASLYKLKDCDAYKKVNVTQDQSPEQREETKKLLKIAYDRNQQNETASFLWKVRGPPWGQRLVKRNKLN